MAYFFCKFITPRKDFLKTMSADEAKLLKAHGEYLQGLLDAGQISEACSGLPSCR